jgi:rubredoxin
MLHEDEEISSRKLVRVEGRSFRGWGCSECAWVFNPAGPPVGRSLDEMTRNFQMQLSEEFASHACAEHRRGRAEKFSS